MSSNGPHIKRLRKLPEFEKCFKRLSVGVQKDVVSAVEDLLKYPIPAVRRFHSLTGYRNPKIFTIDVYANKSYKISMEIDGDSAILRRVGTHKQIDILP